MDMKLTTHFKRSEFDCHDGTEVPDEHIGNTIKVAKALEHVRTIIKCPISIISGYRTRSHNKKVGGSGKSQHLTGSGADFKWSNKAIKPEHVAWVLEALIHAGAIPQGGIGIYSNRIHYDVRGTKARWDKRIKRKAKEKS